MTRLSRIGSAAAAAVAAVAAWCVAGPAEAAVDPGPLHTSGRLIVDAAGRPVRLAAVNWPGFESPRHVPQGLDHRDYKSMLDQIAAEGFNSLRLPYSTEALDPSTPVTGIDYALGANAGLRGLSPIEVMDKIVGYAGSVGLKVILDHHGPGSSSGLWYTPESGEAGWIDGWKMLAARYRHEPAVVGADVHNEPHGDATWGDGNPATDWRLAAERAGNAILDVNPDWLIVVEGVEHGPAGADWWGGNLEAAGQSPVRLNVPGRLVYSPHDYSADVYPQSWFSDWAYPANLPAIWDRNWGYLFRQDIAPVLVGEFGTRLDDASDRQWLATLTDYLGHTDQHGADAMSWAYWEWGPSSADTGGILNADWTTASQDKQALLAPIKFTFPSSAAAAPPAPVPPAVTPAAAGAAPSPAPPAPAPARVATAAAPGAEPAAPLPAARPAVRRPIRLRITGARQGATTLQVAGTSSLTGTGRIVISFSTGAGTARRTVRRTIPAASRWATVLRLGTRHATASGTLEVNYPGDATHQPATAKRTIRRGGT